MIGKTITVKNNTECTGILPRGKYKPDPEHQDQWDGEYTIMDGPFVLGNNPPDVYYLLQRHDDERGMYLMAIDSLSKKWNFRKIEHWSLTDASIRV